MILRTSLFWDTDPQKLDLVKHARYIIERIMDFGNDEEVRWMKRQYPKSLLAHIARNSKTIQANSKNLWTILTNK